MYFNEGDQRAVNEIYEAVQTGAKINKYLIDCRTSSGDTALMLAVQRRNLQVLRALIKAGADVNVSRSSDGRYTALSLAVDKGHTTAVRELLQHGAFLSCQNGIQALEMARQFGFLDAVVEGEEFLIDKNKTETMEFKNGVYIAFIENRIDLLKELVKCGSYISLMHNSTYTFLHREKYLLQCLIYAGINVNIVFEKDKTALIKAIEYRSFDCVDILITARANISFRRNNTWTPLHMATFGHVEMVKMLLDAGADVNAETRDGKTALHLAAVHGDIESIKHLVAAGGSINAQDKNGDSVLLKSIEHGRLKSVAYLVESGALVNVPNKAGVSPIVNIVNIDNLELVQLFLEHGADVNACDDMKNSILVLAVKNENIQLAKYLVQKGADVNACSEWGVPILLMALQLSDLKLVKTILQFGCDVNKTDNDGKMCLHIAVSEVNTDNIDTIKNAFEMLQLLLAHGPDVNLAGKNGKTALHYSVENEHFAFSKVLLQAGADVNLLDTNHDTPLLVACRLYHKSFRETKHVFFGANRPDTFPYKSRIPTKTEMSCKLERRAKMVDSLITPAARVNMADKDGYTAVHLAAQTDNVQIVQRLLGAGGDVRVAANTGETVLHCAASNSCSKIMDILLNVPKSLEVINAKDTMSTEPPTQRRKPGCIASSKTPMHKLKVYRFDRTEKIKARSLQLSGLTALMLAIETGNEQTALKLLSRDPDLNVYSDEDYTALHFAALRSCTEIVRHLLHAGCNVNKQTEEGHTPLMLAGNKEIALMLCDAGTDVNLVNQNGDKALHLAIYGSQADVAQVLINKGAVIDGNFPEPLPPLVLAAALNEIDIVKMLLKAGANVNVLSSSGISPLMAAAACDPGGKRISPIFQILHEHGADFNMTGKKGRTALMYLVKHGNLKAHLSVFLFYGADQHLFTTY